MSQQDLVQTHWKEYAESGLWVFPLPAGGKNPGDLGVKWDRTWIARGRNPYPQLAAAQFDAEGLWLATGRVSRRVVLDIDKPEAGEYWRDKIGVEIFDSALRVNTGKGYHLHFEIPPDDDRPFEGHSDNDLGYDLRGDGGGVVLPPSIHASGRVYEWVPGTLHPVPDVLRHPSPARTGTNVVSIGQARAVKTSTSTLSHLLTNPPSSEGDGRNNWLTSVAGHLAKLWPSPMRDAFDALVIRLGTCLDDPMDEGEAEKVARSIWERETSRVQTLACSAETGWISGDGRRLYTRRRGEDGQIYVSEWADFDLTARRVVQEEDERVFYVDIHTDHTEYLNEPIKADVLGNSHRLSVWLAAHHVSIVGHPSDECKVASGIRLLRYLSSQEPAASSTAPYYGHQSDGTFVTPEGLIEGGGVAPFRDRVPAPGLSAWSRYRYGTVPAAEAVDVLREVLTFQDHTTASVFASWWAMALLKGRYQCSLFPFMLLEAGSESGKTTGFFAQMVALAGNADGAGQHTAASFRDSVAAHRNGIAWLDDMTDMATGPVIDIIRQATSEGSRGKKNLDNKGTDRVSLVCPIMVSGEGSGTMLSEKAMRDRSVRLQFESPKGRRSVHDPARPQWDDVMALQNRYGGHSAGLTAVAGTLVSLVLSQVDLLSLLPSLRTSSAGRHSDKMAILRTGARVLAAVTGDPTHIEAVDKWVADQVDSGAANLAVNEIIPWALRSSQVPTSARYWQPAFVDERDGTVWVSVPRLSDLWRSRSNLTARERQLGSEDAIRTELRATGADTEGKTRYTGGDENPKEKKRYVQIPAEVSRLIMERTGVAE